MFPFELYFQLILRIMIWPHPILGKKFYRRLKNNVDVTERQQQQSLSNTTPLVSILRHRTKNIRTPCCSKATLGESCRGCRAFYFFISSEDVHSPRGCQRRRRRRGHLTCRTEQQQPLLLPLLLLYLLWLCRIYISLFRGKNALSHQRWNLFYLFTMFLQQSNYKLASFLLIDNKLPQRNFFWTDRSSHQILKNLAAYPFFSRQASLVASSHHIFTD